MIDYNKEQINNRLFQILAEINRLQESLEINQDKIAAIVLKAINQGETVILNDFEAKKLVFKYNTIFLWDETSVLHIIAYHDVKRLALTAPLYREEEDNYERTK